MGWWADQWETGGWTDGRMDGRMGYRTGGQRKDVPSHLHEYITVAGYTPVSFAYNRHIGAEGCLPKNKKGSNVVTNALSRRKESSELRSGDQGPAPDGVIWSQSIPGSR